MSTFTKLSYHIVFSTKHRSKLIAESFCERLYEYIGGIIRAKNGHLIEIGGIEDHIHILANLSPTKSISDTIRDIKANSSKWKNELLLTILAYLNGKMDMEPLLLAFLNSQIGSSLYSKSTRTSQNKNI